MERQLSIEAVSGAAELAHVRRENEQLRLERDFLTASGLLDRLPMKAGQGHVLPVWRKQRCYSRP